MLELCIKPLKRIFAIDLPPKNDQITAYLNKHLISLWLTFITHVVPKSLSFKVESHWPPQLASEDRQGWSRVIENRQRHAWHYTVPCGNNCMERGTQMNQPVFTLLFLFLSPCPFTRLQPDSHSISVIFSKSTE